MSERYNSMYFDDKAEALNFIDTLMSMGQREGTDLYNEIKIYNEDCAFIVQWIQKPFSGEYGGSFEFVGEDSYVMLERRMPDGTYELFHTEEDYKTSLKEWLEENPGWKQNQYGHWYNEEEEKKFREEMQKEVNEKVRKIAFEDLK